LRDERPLRRRSLRRARSQWRLVLECYGVPLRAVRGWRLLRFGMRRSMRGVRRARDRGHVCSRRGTSTRFPHRVSGGNHTRTVPGFAMRRCTPFVCGALACLTQCKANTDCVSGVCDANGKCVLGDVCADKSTLRKQDGTFVPCGDYICQGSVCRTECASVDECAAGLVCSGDRLCVESGSDARASEGGCSFTTTIGTRSREGAFGASLVLALALLRTKRRSTTAQR
jgi:hypothetical protein